MFKITLHRDDESVLNNIKNKLGVGNVRIFKDECIFNITDREGISQLITKPSLFSEKRGLDKYHLNTTKYLDYLDLKEALFIYK